MLREKKLVDELADYVIKNLRKGYTKDSLRVALKNQGHSRMEIEKAIGKAEDQLAASAPIFEPAEERKIAPISDDKQEKKRNWFGF